MIAARFARGRRAGFAALLGVAGLSVLALVLMAVLALALRERRQVQSEERRVQAAWLAESGLERARARLENDPAYAGETWALSSADLPGGGGRVEIVVEPVVNDPARRSVRVRADFPDTGTSRARESRRFLIRLPSPTRNEDAP
jgi:hypothetical protein